MTSTTLNPTTLQAIQSTSSTSFSEMRTGHGLTVISPKQVGQAHPISSSSWIGNELFADFDLSAIPAAATITGAVLSPVGTTTVGPDASDAYNCYAYDFGPSVDTGDWRVSEPGGAGSAFAAVINPKVNGVAFQDGGTNTVLSAVLAAGRGHLRFVMAGQTQLQNSAQTGDLTLLFSGLELTVTYTLPAPTVSAITPNQSLLAGGATATITGANFAQPGAGTTTVTIGGNAATGVHVVNDTTITCTIPASATAGIKAVTVTNSNGAGGANIFRYVDVKDFSVKFVKAGSVAGDELADTSTPWPLTEGVATYGAADSLSGLALTDADVNGSGFGLAVSALVPLNNQALVDYADITVYYSTPTGQGEASYLVALHVDTDGLTTQPEVYRLPRAGFTVSQDASIAKAASDASFFTSRMFAPSRNLSKTYRALELWAELAPQTNTPGLQVWASVGDRASVQLRDEVGNPATLLTSGFHRLYFPADTNAVGNYIQLEFRVPALGAGQLPVAVAIRDASIRASLRPVRTEVVSARLVLGAGESDDRMSMRNTVKRQRQLLEAMLGPDAQPEPIRDPLTGAQGYMELVGLDVFEASHPGATEPQWVADVQLRRTYYSG